MPKPTLKFLAAASLAIGGLTFSTSAQQPDAQPPAAQQPDAQQPGAAVQDQPVAAERIIIYGVIIPAENPQPPAGFTTTELKEAPEIRKFLMEATDSVLQPKGSRKLPDFLTREDARRIRPAFARDDNKPLDEAVATLDKAFKAKYGADFDVSKQSGLFDRQYTIVQGKLDNPQLLSNWPVPQPSERRQDQPRDGADRQEKQELPKDKPQVAGRADLPAGEAAGRVAGKALGGKQVAVIVLPSTGPYPDVYVSLVKEEGEWKFDIPDEVDGQKLLTNITRGIEHHASKPESLPADARDAYAMSVRGLAMALYDVEPRSKHEHDDGKKGDDAAKDAPQEQKQEQQPQQDPG